MQVYLGLQSFFPLPFPSLPSTIAVLTGVGNTFLILYGFYYHLLSLCFTCCLNEVLDGFGPLLLCNVLDVIKLADAPCRREEVGLALAKS